MLDQVKKQILRAEKVKWYKQQEIKSAKQQSILKKVEEMKNQDDDF
jgi:cell fate (sporulation/competence/biofilm development) regulator YmcA (YheA/YmcA/DUF963 family)